MNLHVMRARQRSLSELVSASRFFSSISTIAAEIDNNPPYSPVTIQILLLNFFNLCIKIEIKKKIHKPKFLS